MPGFDGTWGTYAILGLAVQCIVKMVMCTTELYIYYVYICLERNLSDIVYAVNIQLAAEVYLSSSHSSSGA